jgi:16S rRNA G527 N7-methylase RsmG
MSDALNAHRTLLEKWRKAMDLVRPGRPLDPHFDDARQAVTRLPRAAHPAGQALAGRWADLGSGAGFPGVALAVLHPGAEV